MWKRCLLTPKSGGLRLSLEIPLSAQIVTSLQGFRCEFPTQWNREFGARTGSLVSSGNTAGGKTMKGNMLKSLRGIQIPPR